MNILVILLLLTGTVIDILRTGASLNILWYVPPAVLVISILVAKEANARLVYSILVISGLVLDILTNSLFGTHGIVMFISLISANVLLRSIDESPRKTLLKLGIVSASYIVLRAVVW